MEPIQQELLKELTLPLEEALGNPLSPSSPSYFGNNDCYIFGRSPTVDMGSITVMASETTGDYYYEEMRARIFGQKYIGGKFKEVSVLLMTQSNIDPSSWSAVECLTKNGSTTTEYSVCAQYNQAFLYSPEYLPSFSITANVETPILDGSSAHNPHPKNFDESRNPCNLAPKILEALKNNL